MARRRFDIDYIITSGRERVVDEGKVSEIAKSIAECGLLNPPAVRIVEEMEVDGELVSGAVILIHGHHRIRALQLLGETDVECEVLEVGVGELGDKRAKLMEVDENLARSELGPAQERLHILLHSELVAEIRRLEDESGKSFPTLPKATTGRGNKQYAAELADLTGESKRIINKKKAEGEALREFLQDIAGTSLDKGVEIEALVDKPAEERRSLVARAKSGEKVSARPAPEERPVSVLKALDDMARRMSHDEKPGADDERHMRVARRHFDLLSKEAKRAFATEIYEFI